MSKSLLEYMDDFINEKQNMGYKYISEVYPLRSLVSSCGECSPCVTDENIRLWSQRRLNEKDITYRSRISVINKFIEYLNKYEFEISKIHIPKHQLNDTFVPIILSKEEIRQIFKVLDNIKKTHGSNSHIDYPIMFRMMYGCGLRVSEVINLKVKDFDVDNKILIILNPKNNQDKLVPLSESLFNILYHYHQSFNKDIKENVYFFRSRFNKHYSRSTLAHMWLQVLERAEIHHDSDKGPRLHDLRHLFCCLSLKQLIDQGKDPYVVLPILSTYVGHKSTKATEKYLHLSKYNYEDLLGKFQLLEEVISYEE